ncbi:MAG: uroporphyrinogen-III synthase [Nitrococcus sp.]|nr:uroporphyrinogen-III synthase [Nitrococcus sp.]
MPKRADRQNRPLTDRRVAVPESRQLDLFASMLEARGAVVLRCPLVDIRDAPDPVPIEAWLEDFSQGGCDDLILLTGEGLRRLLGVAERAGGNLRERFVARLAEVRTITRGPKPARALQELGLRSGLPATTPTTDGVIETLALENLIAHAVGVQLYGSDPNDKLQSFLREAGAEVKAVAPYVYADQAEDDDVAALIKMLAGGSVDAIAFTSSAQVRRLFAVARRRGQEQALQAALARITVAAVGPLVAQTLTGHGVITHVMPSERYFLKPLVTCLVNALGRG